MQSPQVVSSRGAALAAASESSTVEPRRSQPETGARFEQHLRDSLGEPGNPRAGQPVHRPPASQPVDPPTRGAEAVASEVKTAVAPAPAANAAAVASLRATVVGAAASDPAATLATPAAAGGVTMTGAKVIPTATAALEERIVPVELSWTRLPVLRLEAPIEEVPQTSDSVEAETDARLLDLSLPLVLPPVTPEVATVLRAMNGSPVSEVTSDGETEVADSPDTMEPSGESESARREVISSRATAMTAAPTTPPRAGRIAPDTVGTGEGLESSASPQTAPQRSPETPVDASVRRLPTVPVVGREEVAVEGEVQRNTSGEELRPVDQLLNGKQPRRRNEAVPATDAPPIDANESRTGRSTGEPSAIDPLGRRVELRRGTGTVDSPEVLLRGMEGRVDAAMLRRSNPLPFGGTAAAKEDHSMQKPAPENQIAGSTVQKLPGGGRSLPAAESRTTEETLAEGNLLRSRLARSGSEVVNLAMGVNSSRTIAVDQVEAPAGASGAARPPEQLLSNLTREVAQFKRFNAESMAVVLKPDANTEIFLHLVTRNGKVDVQARFERGDFSSLNGQWHQLQQTMAQQGVRLSALQEGHHPAPGDQSPATTQWGHGQSQQQRREAREDAGNQEPLTFEDFIGAGAATEPLRTTTRARKASTRAILEAWA